MTTEKNDFSSRVQIYLSRELMGEAAADRFVAAVEAVLKVKEEVNIIFAAAPSQQEFLRALLQRDVQWQQINAFHMDEYIGLDDAAPQRFGNFLKDRLFGKVNFKSVHYLDGNVGHPEDECARYTRLLENYPVDMVCMGIGENGHLAFNDPPVADFNDPAQVKVVELDPACRQQQVNDGCFASLDLVPTEALTLTIPALMRAKVINCVVPGSTKAQAVLNTVRKPICTDFPSTVLRTHEGVVVFLDTDSAKYLG
ncbi:glucosamine-6-phosphate deaminase [Chitinophaga arvensicola]|uniref:Glucosamine-6-phosphate deaminase n=1 Tax=Chitinophaga arvensicola TaxID=29529 RepID=A0A1I0S779_9BACT|nr:glucosamine-6-phosphate deaminase [Chitinophaga arvensicola]SEW51532.1 glucosamine-6-phosphate deaminase [Chitinophaga arvensicola]